MKYYCLTCGKPTSYTLNLPKFCSECGTPTVEGKFKTPSQDFYNKQREQNTILPDRNPNNFQNGDNTEFLKKQHQPPADPKEGLRRMFPVDKMSMAEFDKHLEPANERVKQFRAKIEFDRNDRQENTEPQYDELESSEDIDSEYFDTSRFKNVKPKFKIETFAASKESLEQLVTQGHMMNSRPEPIISNSVGSAQTQEQILEEFRREAGASRQK